MFQHHSDGVIRVGALSLALDDFLFSEPAYALPDGVAGIEYNPPRRVFAHDGNGNQVALSIPASVLDGYIAKEATYAAAAAQRATDAAAALESAPATVAAVKQEAGRRINAAWPEWKQRNITARGTELVRIRLDRAWTAEEQTEADAVQAVWDWVKSVRAASDAIEADTATLTLSAMRGDSRWPA